MKKRVSIWTASILCALVAVPQVVGAEKVKDDVLYGKYYDGKTGESSNAKVTVNAYDSYNGVIGGYAYYPSVGGENKACNNVVNITGGTIVANNNIGVNTQHPVAVIGGYAEKNVDKNIVNISGGEISGDVYGGYSTRKNGSVIGNDVNISGGTITGDVFGAYKQSGGYIKNNIVKITGGTIEGNVYAGQLDSFGIFENNKVEVDGSSGEIINLEKASLQAYKSENIQDGAINTVLSIKEYEGKIDNISKFVKVEIKNSNIENMNFIDLNTGDYDYDWNLKYGNLQIADSIVNVGKTSNFNELTIFNNNDKKVNLGKILGGRDDSGNGVSIISTDSKFKATSIDGLKELNVNMNFIKWQKDDVIIDVSGTADLTNTKVNVNGTFGVAADTELKNGDRMSLIKAGELKGVNAADITDTKVLQGFAKEVEVKLEDGTNSIDFVISGVASASDQTEIIGQSRAAAYAFVNQGSDALNAVFNGLDDGQYGIKTFAVVHGNRSKYDVGNDIKVNGWSVLTGVGDKKKLSNGDISWGVFYENGTANYRTFNDYNGMDLTGYGSSVYNGGGALARYEADNGIYTELGARLGKLKNSLQGAVIDGLGEIGGYDVRTSYYGAHVGIGKKINASEDSYVDVYGKYFYVHYDDEHLNILGDDVYFGSADSNRLRIGARYNKIMADEMSGYIGLAWEHEFSGDANVTTAGFDVDNAELEGDTAVMELGIKLTPEKSKWNFDLGVQGYIGAREGFSGNVQATYNF